MRQSAETESRVCSTCARFPHHVFVERASCWADETDGLRATSRNLALSAFWSVSRSVLPFLHQTPAAGVRDGGAGLGDAMPTATVA